MHPKLPIFNPDRDGNPFWWLVATAPKHRAERELARLVSRATQRARESLANRPVRQESP